jgi:serine/threonine-protein kinase HipA
MRALRLSYAEAKEAFRRMVFNVIVRNQDDHTKNISFLMGEDGKWRLSPAYDMGYAYNPNGGWTATHQMSINGKFENITRQDLLVFAELNNIKDAASIIDEVGEAVSHWHIIAKECGVPSEMTNVIVSNLLYI